MGQVCEGVKRDRNLLFGFLGFSGFVGVLLDLGLSEKLDYGEINLSELGIPILLGILNEVSDRWEQIGVALEIAQEEIEGIKEIERKRARFVSSKMKLSDVLCEWMSTKATTLKDLQQALASEIVERPLVAKSLKEEFRKACRPKFVIPPARTTHLDSTLKIISQSCDVEVVDGQSTLLEVQVTLNESASYQWLKDGQPLSDGFSYSGVGSDILVISLARLGTEGEYACRISKDGEKVTSDVIILTVNFPPEKEPLMQLYKDLNEVPQDSWPPVGNSSFINLTLINKNKQSGSDDYNYSIRGSVDDILESKDNIEYEEVFGEYKCGELVLVEGRPGGGKTTLVYKVARDWARGVDVLKNAKMVFLIPLKNLAHKSDGNLSDVLGSFYSDIQMCEKLVEDIMKSRGEGVCFIFDGLNEYQPQDKSTSVVYRLLHKMYLHEAMVIVASRPLATATLRDKFPESKLIDVMGFNRAQIFEFLDRFPFSSDISGFSRSKLRHFLYSHCRGSTLNMAKPGPEHILVNCKHIFEQDKQPSYVSVLVLLLSLRYYISLWNPIGS